jgi:hypothetical protein
VLILYAISPILVHGTELGRPDHQSLLMLFVAVAICAEWGWQTKASAGWSVLSGSAWGLAIWVSVYEPFLLLFLLLTCRAVASRRWVFRLWQSPGLRNAGRSAAATTSLSFHKDQRIGAIVFVAIIGLALLIERRVPQFPIFASGAIFRNWSHTIGELRPVSPLNPIWFHWAGYAIAVAPILIWISVRNGRAAILVSKDPGGEDRRPELVPGIIVVLLVATYGLTIWQARWGYFFMLIFAIALPILLQPIRSSVAIWAAFALSIFPILHEWDEKLWPAETEFSRRIESRNESTQLRELSISLKSQEMHPFLAPWWLSPSIAYWSGQPGVAGSSHESLDGIADSARFFLADDLQKAREIVKNHKVGWVVAYDADRTAAISALIVGEPVSEHALCYILGHAPAQAPRFLVFSAQNATAKLFWVATIVNNR